VVLVFVMGPSVLGHLGSRLGRASLVVIAVGFGRRWRSYGGCEAIAAMDVLGVSKRSRRVSSLQVAVTGILVDMRRSRTVAVTAAAVLAREVSLPLRECCSGVSPGND
jgi:hypothetical protein